MLTGECVACVCVCVFLRVSVCACVCLYVFVHLCMYCNSELHDEYFRLLAKTRNMVRTLGGVAAVVGRGVIVLAWRGVASRRVQYRCLVEDCGESFKSDGKRLKHLVKVRGVALHVRGCRASAALPQCRCVDPAGAHVPKHLLLPPPPPREGSRDECRSWQRNVCVSTSTAISTSTAVSTSTTFGVGVSAVVVGVGAGFNACRSHCCTAVGGC